MKRYTKPLAEILKLHAAIAGQDNDGKITAICGHCIDASKTSGPIAFTSPCPTAAIAHKVLNPHIPIGDAKKDALKRIRTETGFDDKPRPVAVS